MSYQGAWGEGLEPSSPWVKATVGCLQPSPYGQCGEDSNLRSPDSESGWDTCNPPHYVWSCSESNRGMAGSVMRSSRPSKPLQPQSYLHKDSNLAPWFKRPVHHASMLWRRGPLGWSRTSTGLFSPPGPQPGASAVSPRAGSGGSRNRTHVCRIKSPLQRQLLLYLRGRGIARSQAPLEVPF